MLQTTELLAAPDLLRNFIAKLGIVIEEADETEFWLELLIESRLVEPNLIQDLLKEADEITAIMVSSKIQQ